MSLPNGSYWIELTADDGISAPTTDSRLVTIQTQQKLGNFALSFVDLDSSVAGLPVKIVRKYDTLKAGASGDFGYGWNLEIPQVKLATDTPLDAVDQFDPDSGFGNGSRILITLPDGTQKRFHLEAEETDASFLGLFRPIIVADDPLGPTLSFAVPPDQMFINDFGHFTIGLTGEAIPFHPSLDTSPNDYILTTQDGLNYRISGKTEELKGISDRAGNTLEFTPNSIRAVSPQGQVISQIAIQRDYANRITAVLDPTGKAIRYGYDPATGDLISVTNRVNESTQFAYNYAATLRHHFLTNIVDPRGVMVLSATFDQASGRLSGLTDAANGTMAFNYSLDLGDGRSVESATSTGTFTQIVRDRNGNVERSVERVSSGDPATNRYMVTVFRYDGKNHRTHASVPFEVVGDSQRFIAGQDFQGDPTMPDFDASKWASIITYDDLGNELTSTDALGHTTHFGNYDQFGNPGTITDSLGHTTSHTFENGKLTQTQDAEGGISQFHYDAAGNLDQQTQIKSNGQVITTTFGYVGGRLTQTTDPANVTRYFVYDSRGNQTLSYFKWDNPAVAAGGDGTHGNGSFDTTYDRTVINRTFYDDENRVTGTAQYTVNGGQDYSDATALNLVPTDWTTSTTYNSAGQVVRTIDKFGTPTYTLYDIRGKAVETRTKTKDETGADRWRVMRIAYDNNGNVVATSDPLSVSNTRDPLDPLFTLAGDTIETPMADRRLTQTVYDDGGRVTETRRLNWDIEFQVEPGTYSVPIYRATFTAPASGTPLNDVLLAREQTIYDLHGNVAQTVKYDTTASDRFNTVLQRIYFQYDAAGRQTAAIQGIDLDQNGTVDVTDTNGDGVPDSGAELVRTTSTFDQAGQKLTETDATGTITSFEYDKTGRLKTATADVGGLNVVTRSEYDKLGRRTASIDAMNRRTEYDYDNFGRMTEVRSPSIGANVYNSTAGQVRYQYGYDVYGNQILIRDPLNHDTTFTYDEQGRQKTRTLPNGQTESFAYNALGQQTQHVDFEGNTTTFGYDSFGRLQSKSFTDGSTTQTVTYTYDALGRVKTVNDNAFSSVTTNTYDAEGRISQIASPQGYLNYAYDNLGRMTRTWSSKAADGADAITDTRYQYDSLGRLITVTVVERNDQTISETTQYRYDQNGNLKQTELPGDLISDYVYDKLNRLDVLTEFVDADHGNDYDPGEVVRGLYDYIVQADGKRTSARNR